MSEQERSTPPVEFREAKATDWPYVERIVSQTWEGDDYITESLWDAWLADESGYLAVGLIAQRIVGLCHITNLGPSEWWLEGLRVHPKGQGQGIGEAIMDHMVDWYKQYADGILRMSVYSTNEASQTLAKSQGFRQIVSYTLMEAEPAPEDYRKFKLLEPQNLDLADRYLKRSPMHRVNHFAEHYWHLFNMTRERLTAYLEDDTVEVIGWRQGENLGGLAVIYHEPPAGRERDGDPLYVGYLDASDDTTAKDMAKALRGLAMYRDRDRVSWKMPTGLGLERTVGAVDLHPVWEGSLLLFERPVNV